MVFYKLRGRQQLEQVPTAQEHSENLFYDQKKSDRRRVYLMLGAGIVGLASLYVAARLDRRDAQELQFDRQPPPFLPDTEPSTLPPTEQIAIQTDGICRFPRMASEPQQIKVLQEFLDAHNYYDGPIDGVYDHEVIEAVSDFQIDSKEAGIYKAVIDGQASFLTCVAMGEPYFIANQ